MDVHIQEVTAEVVVSDPVGPLSPEEIKRLVAIVMEHLRGEQDRSAQREKDTRITDRAFHPGGI
jgi:hypothetical protein